jgi:excinuclease ABC subunit A
MNKNKIIIKGAKEHNLKNISCELPKEKLIVITGPSGSGKSSLAMDTLYEEGRRRYIDSLSSYARQFLGVSKRPDVEKIEGLCPAIAIDQKTVSHNPRSTVGTITEIYDYLRVLFARTGSLHCPSCGGHIEAESPENIAKMLLKAFKNQAITIAAPLAIQKKGHFSKILLKFFEEGYLHFLINGKQCRFREQKDIEILDLSKTYKHNISVIVDKTTVSQDESTRLQEAIEKAFAINNGLCSVIDKKNKEYVYSSHRICVKCVMTFPEIEPRIFSFNSPLGACKECEGLGYVYGYINTNAGSHFSSYFDVPQVEITCDMCSGKRLNKEALAVTIKDKNIHDFCSIPINKLLNYLKEKVSFKGEKEEIARPLLREIINRLTFLDNVGLSYLTLSRSSRTLSGGEGQRIRLATQIGSSLSGVLYILDEPSIGLHQRDNNRLINTLKLLRNNGNTVLVVEHDIDTIKAADHIIDMGPGAGILGGKITAQGPPSKIAKEGEKSITGGYLSGLRSIKIPKKRRVPRGFITLEGVTTNNLKNIDVAFPIGVLASVSGVSGSGKSSLVVQTLAPTLKKKFSLGYLIEKGFEKISGIENIGNVVAVDQSPIGRTPRSNPATYLGIFDDIRKLFSTLPESNARGYRSGRFSFNVHGGRCSTCGGEGAIKVSMHFLEDVIVQCKSCKGKRYNQKTLEITYKGKNIYDILEMSVLEAQTFLSTFPRIKKRVDLLCEVGLDYLKLGQSSTTMSGGEAQRIKLVSELAKRNKNTLYILDEPTTGLHSCDIEKLLLVLNELVNRGNTVLVIEHNLDVLKSTDYIIDIGPEGGEEGGYIVAKGTPEQVVSVKESLTGKYLKD